MDPIFNENDIKELFGEEKTVNVEFQPEKPIMAAKTKEPVIKPRKTHLTKNILKTFGIFALLFFISFTLINGPAIIKQIQYLWVVDFQGKSWTKETTTSNFSIVPPEEDNRIIIPKIGVNAPVNFNIPEEFIPQMLLSGVVHYGGTALPGQFGNAFITGHSSYYSWSKSDYKDVFALLEKLEIGDTFQINFLGRAYIYKVSHKKILSPKDIDVFESDTQKQTLSIMSCWPVGTSLKRLMIYSELVNE